ncbi:MAG TPA: L,D-transpeptidase [Gemmatimonadales bacterium]|nr:L,D-transpeptidase [Gemmatimonadales bacterium]
MTRFLPSFLRSGGASPWILIGAFFLLASAGGTLLANTMNLRYERDVSRMVFNDNVQLLENIRKELGVRADSLDALLAGGTDAPDVNNRPYIVVSIAENMLWYKQGDSVLFEAPVATGSGKVLVKEGGADRWKFETPRGRLTVLDKDEDPQWIPPDWHYIEYARNRGLGVVRLQRGQQIELPDGGAVLVRGSDVVRRTKDGSEEPLGTGSTREVVAGGNVIIPPFGTTQRKYPDVMGTHRLKLGDGYAIHGTNNPASIGQSVSHGCIRLRNDQIEKLYEMVEVGTPVYVY